MSGKRVRFEADQIQAKCFCVWSAFWLLSGCFFLLACQSTEQQKATAPGVITPAFYHWKSTFSPTRPELETLKALNVQKLYIHFFDVDWDARTHRPVPKAFVRFRQKPVGNVVPVIFITNRTLLNLSPTGIAELATHIKQAVTQISQQNRIRFGEVQVDCDWSPRTRDRYFRLLSLLTKQFSCPLSATIRLHQIKYTDQTGIPPVSRGMLMLYNVADWKRADTRNSIYDADVANQYLSFLPTYPLPLDVVLPLFRWTVVYRHNRFLTFLNNVDRKALVNSSFLAPQADSMRFMATRDTVALGLSVQRGDLFRAEAVPAETLVNEKKRLLRQIQNQRITFALYHLDSTALAAYSLETLQTLLGNGSLP
ncbi:hypothetical protein GCM10028818_51730 [Spirosoma horti]